MTDTNRAPTAPMTLTEFCAAADRIGLKAETLAQQLAARPEFADCLPPVPAAGDSLQDLHNELYRAQITNDPSVLATAIGKARILLARYRDSLALSAHPVAAPSAALGERDIEHLCNELASIARTSSGDGLHAAITARVRQTIMATPPAAAPAKQDGLLTDEQIIERCKAAAIPWLAPDLENDHPKDGGFPGSFDMVPMRQMRALLAAPEAGSYTHAEVTEAHTKGYALGLSQKDRAPEAPAVAASASDAVARDFEQMRARTLLAHLWRCYDAAGTSMGRSHQAVVLEAARALLGDPDADDIALLDKDVGDLVNRTRSYLSSKLVERLFGAAALTQGVKQEGGAA